MKKILTLALVYIFSILYTNSQTWTAKPGVSVGSYSGGFYEYLPAGYGGAKKFPLIIFLHGVNESGNGTTQLSSIVGTGLPMMLQSGELKPMAVVICPQTAAWSFFGDQINQAIDYAIKNYSIDQARIYVTGLSMGGGATWDFAQKYGGRAAAVLPICGALGANAKGIDSLVKFGLPMWAHHAGNDPTVSVSFTNAWVDGANAKGIKPAAIKTLYPTPDYQIDGHGIWNTVYRRKDVWDWLFAQVRGGTIQPPVIDTTPVPPVSQPTIKLTPGTATGYTSDKAFRTGGNYSNQMLLWGMNFTIAGGVDQNLYSQEAWGAMSYKIPLANGTYTVRLMFAEIFHNAAGRRVFNVDIEGQRVLTNFDIVSFVPRFNPIDRSFSVAVTDGVLNINFTNVVDNAKITAIEITPSGGAVIPPSQYFTDVSIVDSATGKVLKQYVDTFSVPVKVIVKQ